jgi:hypothetical protein
MLEVLEVMKGKSIKQQALLLQEAYIEFPLLSRFLILYQKDKDRIITPMKIFKMMKYYNIESSNDIDKIGEIGSFAASRIELLKRKEFGWRNNQMNLKLEMKDVKFLIDTYNALKIDVTNKKLYHRLKSCLLLLKPLDICWYIRLLCRMVDIKKVLEVIENGKI